MIARPGLEVVWVSVAETGSFHLKSCTLAVGETWGVVLRILMRFYMYRSSAAVAALRSQGFHRIRR